MKQASITVATIFLPQNEHQSKLGDFSAESQALQMLQNRSAKYNVAGGVVPGVVPGLVSFRFFVVLRVSPVRRESGAQSEPRGCTTTATGVKIQGPTAGFTIIMIQFCLISFGWFYVRSTSYTLYVYLFCIWTTGILPALQLQVSFDGTL